MDRTISKILVVVGIVTLGTSCSSKKPSEESTVKLSKDEQQFLDDYKAEVEIGRNMAGRLLAFYGEYLDPGLTAYINKVGRFVANNGDYPDRRYLFAILDSDSPNAFACPGGYILLTRGVIQNAENEAEIGAILGHEAAHVGKQHMFKTLKTINKADADKAEAELASRRRPDKYSRTRARPIPEDSENGSALAKFMEHLIRCVRFLERLHSLNHGIKHSVSCSVNLSVNLESTIESMCQSIDKPILRVCINDFQY